MRKIIYVLVLALFAGAVSLVNAQDIIIQTNGEEIKAKVLEVGTTEVKYKQYGNESGPIYSLAKSKIFMIKYENNSKDVFTEPGKQTETQSTPTRPAATAAPMPARSQPTVAQKQETQAYSQPAEVQKAEPKARVGIKGGLNISTITAENANSSAGAVVGLTLECPLSPQWFFHLGLEYSMKGFSGKDGSISVECSANYILIPAAVGCKLSIGKGWNLEPRVGLYFAYGVGGETTGKVSKLSASIDTFDDEILSSVDVGAMGGFFFDNGRCVIGFHGENGMMEANADNLTVTGGTARTSTFSITLGYLF
ncbi:MAG: PorT family protein [Dysgonamonadaceae bacterium]|jgi:hypothetical protein|nr:PorT family protein [Dysgonamonadaceae bacterium]